MQMRLGAEKAKTKFVAICESDFLLPRRFFEFRPPDDKMYCWPKNGYITWQKKRPYNYYRKRMTQTVGIVGRDHLLALMDRIVETKGDVPLFRLIPQISSTGLFDLGSVVTLKTRRQMHLTSPFIRKNPLRSLPEWGPALEMWAKYVGTEETE
jgi:hypothetical protein